MRKFNKLILTVSFLIVIVWVPFLQAEWIEDGAGVCTATNEQINPKVVADNSGGAIIVWEDQRLGELNPDIYAQRVDRYGDLQWAGDGKMIYTSTGSGEDHQVISDGTGGAIIAWKDFRGGISGIYAQRIASSGDTLWAATGVDLFSEMASKSDPRIASDGNGGAIVVWRDYAGGNDDIFAQRIDADGVIQWTPAPVVVCGAAGMQVTAAIVSDGLGGAIVTWWDWRSEVDIYAQKIDSDGTVQWTADGVPICTAVGTQDPPNIVSDGAGGAIIVWRDGRNSEDNIYAQRIASNGTVQWAADGIPVCMAAYYQYDPQIVSDGAGGAIIAWDDERSMGGFDFYIQRVDANGNIQWRTDGILIYTTAKYRGLPKLMEDGNGGAFVTCLEEQENYDYYLYADRISTDGQTLWAINGVPVCSEPGERWNQALASDGHGGIIVAWEDYRGGDADIYCQRVSSRGHVGYYYPAPYFSSIEDVPKDQGGKLSLRWNRSEADTFPNNEITYYSLWRLLPDGGMGGGAGETLGALEHLDITLDFHGPAVRFYQTALGDTWEWLGNVPARHSEVYALTVESLYDSIGTDPGWQYFVVTAHTDDLTEYYDSPIDSGYSVDNLSPDPPQGFAGIQTISPPGLHLSWEPNTEPDLSFYAAHRGNTEDFVPDVSNLLATTADTTLLDGDWTLSSNYFYKLAAVDVHGNGGGSALLRPEDIIVGTFLQSYMAVFRESCIKISWILSEAGESMRFFIFRSEADRPFEEILDPDIIEVKDLSFEYRDNSCERGTVYRYRVEVSDEDGRRMLFETEPVSTPAMPLTLYQNRPNPFNPFTTIRYYLPENGKVTLKVYDILGQKVASLVDGKKEKGFHFAQWTGRDEQGNPAASGVYLYRLTVGKETLSQKMILLR